MRLHDETVRDSDFELTRSNTCCQCLTPHERVPTGSNQVVWLLPWPLAPVVCVNEVQGWGPQKQYPEAENLSQASLEEPSLCGVTGLLWSVAQSRTKETRLFCGPSCFPARFAVKRPERGTGHVQWVRICYVIVFISPVLGTPWLGVRGPAGSSPNPSRTAGRGCDPVTSWMSSCAHGVSAKPSSRIRKHVLTPQSRLGCACSCAPGPPGEAVRMQPCVPRPISGHLLPPSPPTPAPAGGRGCSSLCSPHVEDEMPARRQGSPQRSYLQSRCTLSVRVLSWGESPGAPPPGAEPGPGLRAALGRLRV